MSLDTEPRYTPEAVICRMHRVPVLGSAIHPAGQHPSGSPLRKDIKALELRTELGSRWYGIEDGWINSELRMVVSGFPAGFEEMRAWEKVPEGRAGF
jgi:hypothetical protein